HISHFLEAACELFRPSDQPRAENADFSKVDDFASCSDDNSIKASHRVLIEPIPGGGMMGISTAFNTSLSGLTAIETDVNVIGDNIANAATTGFKQSTVAFATQLAQTWSLGFSPSNNNAGTNPVQVGLGTEVESINPDLTQGSIHSTGIPSDLAIDGNG